MMCGSPYDLNMGWVSYLSKPTLTGFGAHLRHTWASKESPMTWRANLGYGSLQSETEGKQANSRRKNDFLQPWKQKMIVWCCRSPKTQVFPAFWFRTLFDARSPFGPHLENIYIIYKPFKNALKMQFSWKIIEPVKTKASQKRSIEENSQSKHSDISLWVMPCLVQNFVVLSGFVGVLAGCATGGVCFPHSTFSQKCFCVSKLFFKLTQRKLKANVCKSIDFFMEVQLFVAP